MVDESLKWEAYFQKKLAEVDLAKNIDFIYAVTCMSMCNLWHFISSRASETSRCAMWYTLQHNETDRKHKTILQPQQIKLQSFQVSRLEWPLNRHFPSNFRHEDNIVDNYASLGGAELSA